MKTSHLQLPPTHHGIDRADVILTLIKAVLLMLPKQTIPNAEQQT